MKLFAFLLLSTTFIASVAETKPTPSPTHKISKTVTLSGLLDETAKQEIEANSALVIDLGTEQSEAERQTLQARDIDYIHLPTKGETPKIEHVRLFDQLLTAAGQRHVWVHCTSANRASMMWATREIYNGLPHNEAYAAVRHLVTKQEIEQAILSFGRESSPAKENYKEN